MSHNLMDAEDIYSMSKSRDEKGEVIMGMNAYIFIDLIASWYKKANRRIKSSEAMVSIFTAHRLETV